LNKSEEKIPFTLIAGPCVIENKELSLDIAKSIKEICETLKIRFIFKSSFDKANRSSGTSFRGPGLTEGLNILYSIKEKLGLEILTDIHEPFQAKEVSKVVDVLQIPAFLCRQTNLLNAAAESIIGTKKILNIKKGQFLAPWDMEQVINKLIEKDLNPSSKQIWITERGTSFGYNTLVVDFRSLPQLKNFGCPIIFDATHSVQQPGGRGSSSGGQREFVAPLSKAAVAVGVDGLFMEVHPDPDKALSDGPNMVPLKRLKKILEVLLKIDKITKNFDAPSTY
tara:strand:- start:38 stop:880 length:843 start_codon:yes stop_codon:yes gene_type:complete